MHSLPVAGGSGRLSLFDALRNCERTRDAYSTAHDLLDSFDLSDGANQLALAQYLVTPTSPWRELLLSAAADSAIELSPPLLGAIVDLLDGHEMGLAQSAALALAAGGEDAVSQLSSAMHNLDPERRRALERLVRLTGASL